MTRPDPTDDGPTTFGELHVVPLMDLREHVLSPYCWCRPVEDDEPDVWLHNSADGREHTHERGRLQ